jgi:ribonuclease HII
MITAGIDEAGRGAVIGPLVVCGASFDEEGVNALRKMRVRDSKELSPRRREILSKAIHKVAKDIMVVKISPCIIDNRRADGVNLNQLEGMKMADIINYLTPDMVFIDSPDVNTGNHRSFVAKLLEKETELHVEHKADKNHPEVSAASIIAKVERDRDVAELAKKHGPIGSGYPSDERTMNWLRIWLHSHDTFPDLVRRSWVTIEMIEKEKSQSKLSEWFRGRKIN